MLVVSCSTGGEDVWAELFILGNWKCFHLRVIQQRWYGKTETAALLSATNMSSFGIHAGRVGHHPLYRPDTTISGTRSSSGPVRSDPSRADLKFCPMLRSSQSSLVWY